MTQDRPSRQPESSKDARNSAGCVTRRLYLDRMFEVDTDATPEFLERQLLAGEMLISQVRARQAEMLRAADSAQVHTREGAASIQEWVRGRLDVSDSTARDLVALSKAPRWPEQLAARRALRLRLGRESGLPRWNGSSAPAGSRSSDSPTVARS